MTALAFAAMNTMVDKLIHKLLKNKLFLGFVVLMAFLLVISAILRAITPTPPPAATVITTEDQGKIKPEIVFEGLQINIPKKLKVYQASPLPTSLKENAEDLAKKLNLTTDPRVKNFWQNATKTQGLLLENNDSLITYQVYDERPLKKNTNQDVSFIKNNVRDFLTQHSLLPNTTFSDPEPRIKTPEFFDPVENIFEADVFELSAILKLDQDVPFTYSTQLQSPAQIFTDANGNILKITFYPLPQNFTEVEQYTTFSLERVLENMRNGEITYIQVGEKYPTGNFDPQITTVKFTEATLEYRQHPKNGYILPYLHVTGDAINEKQQDFTVQAISPLIRVE